MFLDRLTGLNLTEKASDSLRANFHSSYFACDRRQLHFRSHRRKFAHAFIEAALEILRNIRVERIRRLIRRQRTVTPELVHSEPGAGFFRTTGSNWSQQACAISWSDAPAGNSIRG